ncbi:hypothetical protein Mgra_00005167 [Meloidogyne graminicola]|uniref:Uncharacterized protein n=1 Tax=Meloidogyne graminicola TaxID=189291 RepID=A0A8S9ZQ60_9BILA|nr:hypothetical protein Mgra_00005167 [Meloidogyne graminicola]
MAKQLVPNIIVPNWIESSEKFALPASQDNFARGLSFNG